MRFILLKFGRLKLATKAQRHKSIKLCDLASLWHKTQIMLAKINNFEIDLSKPIDISIPLTNTDENPIAWYIEKPVIEPVVFGDWIGKVSEGKSSTNFNNIFFNPHGHGTHTECLGHITNDFYSINQSLKQFFFFAKLITVEPEKIGEDFVITKEQVQIASKYFDFAQCDTIGSFNHQNTSKSKRKKIKKIFKYKSAIFV